MSLQTATTELENAVRAWNDGQAGRGRVGSRRAAGMALRVWINCYGAEGYGTSFMHHLNAMADDETQPVAIREAAWRLAARKAPEAGFEVALAPSLTPMADAQLIMDWVAEGVLS